MLKNMHISLGKRNTDSFYIQALFDIFLKFEENIPVVTSLDPGAHRKIDAAIGQCE
jgi:hypothetical protein